MPRGGLCWTARQREGTASRRRERSVARPAARAIRRHGIEGQSAITTLIFRNYFTGVPTEVLQAGRMDGAGLFGLYRYIVLTLSIPAFVVVLILQFTQVFNDFLFAVVLTSNATWPVTVALNNLAGSQIVQWNLQMAGALLTALPTLLVYILLGRFFLRGLMPGRSRAEDRTTPARGPHATSHRRHRREGRRNQPSGRLP